MEQQGLDEISLPCGADSDATQSLAIAHILSWSNSPSKGYMAKTQSENAEQWWGPLSCRTCQDPPLKKTVRNFCKDVVGVSGSR